jgi:hypothetical protein
MRCAQLWKFGSIGILSGVTDLTISTPSPAELAELRAHPQLHLAMRTAARGILGLYRRNRILGALMSDRARALFTNAVFYLHFSGPSGGKPGLTVNAMKDLCVQLDLCSRGRCEATLALMRATGFLRSVPSADRRRRPLVPTQKLLAFQRKRWAAHLVATAYVLPEAAGCAARLEEEEFCAAFVLALSTAYIEGVRMLEHVPELTTFVDRSAGLMILYSLALSGPSDEPFPPAESVPLSINAIAKTLGVSRKHVLTLLRDAEAAGLLLRDGADNDRITFLPAMRAAMETMFASIFLTFARSAVVAKAQADPHTQPVVA